MRAFADLTRPVLVNLFHFIFNIINQTKQKSAKNSIEQQNLYEKRETGQVARLPIN